MESITISTEKPRHIIDITGKVKAVIEKSGVKDGVCLVYTPHSTCAVMINENYDSNIMLDIIDALETAIPHGKWRHDSVDDNAAAHIKASIIGPSEAVPIKDGKLMLGRWQDIMLADFDGPRKREIFINIINK